MSPTSNLVVSVTFVVVVGVIGFFWLLSGLNSERFQSQTPLQPLMEDKPEVVHTRAIKLAQNSEPTEKTPELSPAHTASLTVVLGVVAGGLALALWLVVFEIRERSRGLEEHEKPTPPNLIRASLLSTGRMSDEKGQTNWFAWLWRLQRVESSESSSAIRDGSGLPPLPKDAIQRADARRKAGP
jgi:hypothetical protein